MGILGILGIRRHANEPEYAMGAIGERVEHFLLFLAIKSRMLLLQASVSVTWRTSRTATEADRCGQRLGGSA
jgi:hypothetical protein